MSHNDHLRRILRLCAVCSILGIAALLLLPSEPFAAKARAAAPEPEIRIVHPLDQLPERLGETRRQWSILKQKVRQAREERRGTPGAPPAYDSLGEPHVGPRLEP